MIHFFKKQGLQGFSNLEGLREKLNLNHLCNPGWGGNRKPYLKGNVNDSYKGY